MATDVLQKFSAARAERVASMAPRALALRLGSRYTVSAIHWRETFVVTASDALRGADPVHVVGPEGDGRADFAGADTTVDVAVLKLDPTSAASSAPALASAAPETGATIAVVGRSTDGVLAA